MLGALGRRPAMWILSLGPTSWSFCERETLRQLQCGSRAAATDVRVGAFDVTSAERSRSAAPCAWTQRQSGSPQRPVGTHAILWLLPATQSPGEARLEVLQAQGVMIMAHISYACCR